MTLREESTLTALDRTQPTGTPGAHHAGADLHRMPDDRPAEAWGCLCRRSC